MEWYDFFSGFYDKSLENLYRDSRRRAIEVLDLQDDHAVLDVSCGTGANFDHIKADQINVRLYGTDYSKGMLKKAAARVRKHDWKHVHLFHADATKLDVSTVGEFSLQHGKFDRILCVLGLSVVPHWEKVLDNMLSMLKEDGRIVVVDVCAEKRTFNTWLVEKIAGADLDRPIWQKVKSLTRGFTLEYFPVNEAKVGGRLFIASGLKLT